jgi:hypothetical protein
MEWPAVSTVVIFAIPIFPSSSGQAGDREWMGE